MTEQELSDVISAVIEARMLVPWQDAEPAAKALATMVKQYIERHLAAGQHGAGCGACGDGCKGRGSCRLADESPKPAGAVPLPEVAATVCLTPDGYAHGHMLDLQVQVKPMETFAIGDRLCRYDDAIRYGNAREAAARDAGRADAVPDGRQEFEKWAQKRHGLSVTRWDDSGEYTSHLTRNWWQCWTESRSTIAAAPQPMTTQGEAVGIVNVGTIGHVSHDKGTLTAALTKIGQMAAKGEPTGPQP